VKGIVLTASGYTWICPECGRENYTGAAPGLVSCLGCKAEWPVIRLAHRKADAEHGQTSLFSPPPAESANRLFDAEWPIRDGGDDHDEG
jgi:hypothetical protein